MRDTLEERTAGGQPHKRPILSIGMMSVSKVAGIAVIAALTFAGSAKANSVMPSGVVPSYLPRIQTAFPNSFAIIRSAFVPDLDNGFVPQGLANYGNDVLLSGYLSGAAPSCRVFKINKTSLSATVSFDVPGVCVHAGGIMASPSGQIIVADPGMLISWTPGADGLTPSGTIRQTLLRGGLRGTFITAAANGFILGTYSRDTGLTTARMMPWSTLAKRSVQPSDAVNQMIVPEKTQGMGLSPSGNVWTTSQAAPFNFITLLSKEGSELSKFSFVRGIQGIFLDQDGTLWTVSESGAAPYQKRQDTFPAIMQIDPSKLSGAALGGN